MDYSISHNGSAENIFSSNFITSSSSYQQSQSATDLDSSNEEENLINVKPLPIETPPVQDGGRIPLVIKKKIQLLDIILGMISRIAGKDKIAKLIQYSLNIFKVFLIKSRGYIIESKSLKFNPVKALTRLIIANSMLLEQKITFVASQISSFRYAMRFGTSPFLIYKFLTRLQQTFYSKDLSFQKLTSTFLNLKFLGEANDVYYQIFDELEFLFKLKVFTNPEASDFVSKQAAIGWMIDILLTFKNKYYALQENKYKQQDLRISMQVRAKASELSAKFLNNNNFRNELLKEFSSKNNNNLELHLASLKQEETELYLDIVKNSCDFTCDFIDLFGDEIKKHVTLSPLVYLVSGWSAGIIGARKVWIACEQELQNQ